MVGAICEAMPTHDCYVNLCAGSAAELFSKPKVSAERLVDLNPWVVSTLVAIRDCPSSVIGHLPLAVGEPEWRDACDWIREKQAGDDGIRDAAAVIVATACSYGQSPWSGSRSRKMSAAWDVDRIQWDIRRGADRLVGVRISRMDAIEALDESGRGTLVFCDPPYRFGSGGTRRAHWKQYGQYEPSTGWFFRLLDAIERAVLRGVRMILTTGDDRVFRQRLLGIGFDLLGTFDRPGVAASRHLLWRY